MLPNIFLMGKKIRRCINSDNKGSIWLKNGKKTTQHDVKHFMALMNIDVDNLCSFMAQDKVGTFTQQSAQGILQKTLQSINLEDGRTLYDEQMELAEHQKSNKTKENEMRAKQKKVDDMKAMLNSMEGEVERMKQRNQMVQLLKLYEVKALVLAAQECEARLVQRQVLVL